FRSRVRKERVLGLAISGFGAGVVLFSLLAVTWISFLVAFLGGVFMGYAIVGMVTLLHEKLDEEYRGRAFATIQVIMRASIFVSIMLAGPLADLITGLGRRLGLRPLSLWLVRLGGSYRGEIDGRYVDFRYLLNGPQLILLIGGLVIFAAGLYGQRSFHRCFAGEESRGGPLTAGSAGTSGSLDPSRGEGGMGLRGPCSEAGPESVGRVSGLVNLSNKDGDGG
ncbi:MAG: hypothetical protein QME89_12060, partial [Actinomycetota bacterium]|nr:hypothetical protein [Actinomycetota bacterium]